GTTSFTATAADAAGNTSVASAQFNVTIDITPPTAPVFTGVTTDTGTSTSDNNTSDTSLILNGTAEASSVVTITRVGTGVIGTATTNGSGVWTFDYTATTLPEGQHSF